jgi:hypothetical protein
MSRKPGITRGISSSAATSGSGSKPSSCRALPSATGRSSARERWLRRTLRHTAWWGESPPSSSGSVTTRRRSNGCCRFAGGLAGRKGPGEAGGYPERKHRGTSEYIITENVCRDTIHGVRVIRTACRENRMRTDEDAAGTVTTHGGHQIWCPYGIAGMLEL